MLDTFAENHSTDLRGMIVWVPMVSGDSALEASNLVSPDPRFVVQAWDSDLRIGKAFQKLLALKCPAWDVYLVYEPGQKWEGDLPPQPKMWWHQLGVYSGANPKLHLQPQQFKDFVRSF